MQNLKKKWIAWLAVICMLATMIPLSAVMATAEDVNTGEAVFSNLKLQLIHRLPSQSDTDHKSALQIFVSGDGVNWSEGYKHTTADSGKWLCDTLPTIDLTALAGNVTGDELYIKVGMGAGDAGWCGIHQLRVEGTYAGASSATELVWDNYEGLTPVASDNVASAQAVVDAVPGIVDANNVKLGSCVVGGCGKTAIIPYYGGSYEETGAYITYKFDLDNKPVEPDVPDEPDGPVGDPVLSNLKLQMIHRLPSVSDTDYKSALQIFVSGDGVNWSEGYKHTTDGSGKWLCDTLPTIDLTALAGNVTGDELYIKVGMGAGDAGWCAIHQLRVIGTFVNGSEEKQMVWDNYEGLTPVMSSDVASAEAVVAAVPGIVAAHNVKLGKCVVDGCGKTAIIPFHAGSYEETGAHITYKFDLNGGDPIQPDAPADPEKPDEPDVPDIPDVPVDPDQTYKLDNLFFEYLGRLPENGEGKNKVHVALSKDGKEWVEVYVQNPFKDGSGNTAWLGGQYAKADLSEAAAAFLGTELTDLYVRIGLNAGINNWCAVEQIRFTGKVNGTDGTLLYEKYDEMSAGTNGFRSDKYIDSDLIRLAKISYDGAYVGVNPQPDMKIVTLQPGEPYDLADPQPYRCYITYKLLGAVDPDEVKPDDGGDNPGGPGEIEGELLNNNINMGYNVNFNGMEAGATDWYKDVYEIGAMKIFYDAGDNYVMLCPDSSKNDMGYGFVTYKITADEGQKLGLVGVSMKGRIFDLDADDSRGLTVEYSLDDGATWILAKHFYSTTVGNKQQTYKAALGIVDQSSVLVRITMSSGMNDWVGLTDLEIGTPGNVPSEYEIVYDSLMGSRNWLKDVYNAYMAGIFSSAEGYKTLTTDMQMTAEGKGYVEYLVIADEGKTLDGLKAIMLGRVFDFNNDVNRGLDISYSDDYGQNYTHVMRFDATENSAYSQEYIVDLNEAATGKASLLVRFDFNSAWGDWVAMESLTFTTGGNLPGDDDGDDGDDPTIPDDGDDNDDPIIPDDGDDNDDEDPSPETGDSLPYVAMALLMSATAAAFVLRKKQTN